MSGKKKLALGLGALVVGAAGLGLYFAEKGKNGGNSYHGGEVSVDNDYSEYLKDDPNFPYDWSEFEEKFYEEVENSLPERFRDELINISNELRERDYLHRKGFSSSTDKLFLGNIAAFYIETKKGEKSAKEFVKDTERAMEWYSYRVRNNKTFILDTDLDPNTLIEPKVSNVTYEELEYPEEYDENRIKVRRISNELAMDGYTCAKKVYDERFDKNKEYFEIEGKEKPEFDKDGNITLGLYYVEPHLKYYYFVPELLESELFDYKNLFVSNGVDYNNNWKIAIENRNRLSRAINSSQVIRADLYNLSHDNQDIPECKEFLEDVEDLENYICDVRSRKCMSRVVEGLIRHNIEGVYIYISKNKNQ